MSKNIIFQTGQITKQQRAELLNQKPCCIWFTGLYTKGLYQKARNGEIEFFTGISSAYEQHEQPELHLKTGVTDIYDCVNQIVQMLEL
jgi:adenylylsulfate kinase-like enzyme